MEGRAIFLPRLCSEQAVHRNITFHHKPGISGAPYQTPPEGPSPDGPELAPVIFVWPPARQETGPPRASTPMPLHHETWLVPHNEATERGQDAGFYGDASPTYDGAIVEHNRLSSSSVTSSDEDSLVS